MQQRFVIDIPSARLDGIRARVDAFDFDDLPDAGGWSSGVGLADLHRLVDHWRSRYDWAAQQAQLNQLPQFLADAGGQQLHYVHVRGSGARRPLLLLHGWPGSFLEFARLIDPLAHPERHGGRPEDGFDVVVPSLPGYAFSARPASPVGPRATAALMHALMTTLGYDRFFVQGGDWGAAIAAWMAHDHPQACRGLHLNMVLLQAADVKPQTEAERAWADARAAMNQAEGGYSHLQGTKPQTLAVAMSDSPVGVAAWILEKFAAWSDLPRRADGAPDLWAAYDEDLLLTNIMLYVATRSFPTSTWMYRGRVLEGSGMFPEGSRLAVPTAVAAFPDPVFAPPPRSLAQRTYNVIRWTDMPRGGHFAALEQPKLLVDDLQAFAAGL